MRKSLLTLLGIASLLLASARMAAAEEVDLKGIKCVLNAKGDAKATSSADYKGGKVYFCCDNCKGKFTKEPKEFATAANAQLVATKQMKQIKCPLTGKDTSKDVTFKAGGVVVDLCCGGCQEKLKGMEEKAQLEAVFGEKAFEKSFELVKKEAEKPEKKDNP